MSNRYYICSTSTIVTLSKTEYTLVYGLLSALKGGTVLQVATSYIDRISESSEQGKADEIDLIVKPYELETLLSGIVALALDPHTTVQDFVGIKQCAKALKIGTAFNAKVEETISKESNLELDANIELDA